MDLSQRRHAWLRRLALLCSVLVLAITSLSAFIRLSNAGLGCSEWPQCYGERLRHAQQGRATAPIDTDAVVAARLAHRVVAVLALLLVIAMVVVCLGNRPMLWREGVLALALLALALGLAVLGRWTAGARVPAVAIANLLGGLLMLTFSWRLAAQRDVPGSTAWHVWARVGGVLLLAQVTLGALVSSSFAGLSCSGATDCVREAAAGGWPWQALSPWREPVFGVSSQTPNPVGALVQVVHRGGALLVVLVLAPLGWAASRAPSGARRRAGAAVLLLLALQIALGLVMVATVLPLAPALAHNIVAALLLATLVRLA